jgi:two-component system, NtrC family, sensor histidine kinase HydH
MPAASDIGQSAGEAKADDAMLGSAAGKPFNLLRWFSIVSLAALLGIGVALTWFLTHYLTAHMLMRDAEVSQEFLESIVTAEKTSDYLSPNAPRPSTEDLARFVEHLPTLPDLARANLYGADRTVLWSTDQELIGRRFDNNTELERALGGEIVVESGRVAVDESKAEHIGLSKKAARGQSKHFVEAYLPIRDESGQKVLAVVEIYKLPRALFDAIDEGVYLVWISDAIGGVFLYLAFFWIVRRGDTLMREQRERLVEAEMLTAIGEMAATVAHNIRNPLASIRSAAELAHDEDRCGIDECLKDIMNQADRLDGWVRELLVAARGAGMASELVDLNALLREILDGNATELRRRGIELTFRTATLPLVRGSVRRSGTLSGA